MFSIFVVFVASVFLTFLPHTVLAQESPSEMRKFLLTMPRLLLSQVSVGVVSLGSSGAGGKVTVTGPKRCKEPPKGKVQKVSGVQSGEVECVNGCRYEVKVQKANVLVKAEDPCEKLQGEAKKQCEKKPGEVKTGVSVEKCPGGKVPSVGSGGGGKSGGSESLLKPVSATKPTKPQSELKSSGSFYNGFPKNEHGPETIDIFLWEYMTEKKPPDAVIRNFDPGGSFDSYGREKEPWQKIKSPPTQKPKPTLQPSPKNRKCNPMFTFLCSS
ncbi:MAG TPA: hypothetical protein VJH33_03285 [Candidatus Paceibacterota bacterium]